jgi:hypothetical protein
MNRSSTVFGTRLATSRFRLPLCGDVGGAGKTTGAAAGGESGGVAVRDLGPDTETVATVEGCNDQDRVARQLCEAATKEADPFLRASLWDEYDEYKRLLAR